MSKVKQAIVFSIAMGVAISLSSISSLGNTKIAKKEKAACTACHVKMGQQDLNAVGKCYAKKKDLKACESESK